ncbi:hypothetical protein [Mycobacterium sp. Lab-001]|uniref:hypothetical protein n=1 Tax=Mycobacterium sp. Lab-001 TaxID=3410136 RepID=UPI003D16CBEF
MSDDGGDAAARVDVRIAEVAPRLGPPTVVRRDVVVVAGPWLAGVSAIAEVLRERLPQHTFVESTDLGPGDAPGAVVFVVSAAAPLTPSDCALLDAAAGSTDVVVGVVSKIDVHHAWRDVIEANRETLAGHAPRYARVPWVGAAALPDLGEPRVDEVVECVAARLADPDIARRNRLRAWEARLQHAAQRFDREADGPGRRARVDALRDERSTALRERRQARSERTIALRGQIQQARVQLSHFARNRCSSVRSELQEDAANLSRRDMPGFEAQARARADEVVAEVGEGTATHLADVSQAVGVPVDLPFSTADPGAGSGVPPSVDAGAPTLRSRRQETWLMTLLGAGFGLGVALTLSRLVSGLAPRPNAAVEFAGAAACVAVGLAVTFAVVNLRGLLHDRAVLDRWAGDLTASLRSVVEELVATRVLAAEAALSTALVAREEAENAQFSRRVSAIDTELREHAVAAARAAAVRDEEMPALTAALEIVREELDEPGIRPPESRATDADTG